MLLDCLWTEVENLYYIVDLEKKWAQKQKILRKIPPLVYWFRSVDSRSENYGLREKLAMHVALSKASCLKEESHSHPGQPPLSFSQDKEFILSLQLTWSNLSPKSNKSSHSRLTLHRWQLISQLLVSQLLKVVHQQPI